MSNYKKNNSEEYLFHKKPKDLRDRFALGTVKILRFFADKFFAKRYGNRAVVLETIAAVPGMVGGAILHLKSLRKMQDDEGWIRTLLDEAENERMHLMTFVEIAKPTKLERYLVMIAQGTFYIAYFLLYLISYKTAHRMVGYLEEEAVISYTQYLECIDRGELENISAPQIAIEYWNLKKEASLRDIVIAVRADEMKHREVNHCMANKISGENCKINLPKRIYDKFKKHLNSLKNRKSP